MDKQQFLYELAQKLQSLPPSETDKIIAFYSESIFDRTEGGITEQQAVQELGSIDKIASEILDDISVECENVLGGLNGASANAEGTNTSGNPGEGAQQSNFTNPHFNNNINGANTQNGNYANYNTAQTPNGSTYAQQHFANAPYQNAPYQNTTYPNGEGAQQSTKSNTLFIVLAVVLFPIWVPLLFAATAIVFSFFITVWSFVVAMYSLPLAFALSAFMLIFIGINVASINILTCFMSIGMCILLSGLFLLSLVFVVALTKGAIKISSATVKFIVSLVNNCWRAIR